MVLLKAGYYIDEINKALSRLAGPEIVKEFWKDNLYFSAKGLPLRIEPEKPSPLLKVAWNIITRGEPTRASIYLSDFLLKKYFKQQYKGVNDRTVEIQLEIIDSVFADFEKSDLVYLLEKFSEITPEELVENGSNWLAVWRLLYMLITSAQVQRCVLIYLMDNNDIEIHSLHITGVEQDVAKQIICDLNNLFSALNTLTSEEEKLPELRYDDENFAGTQEIGINQSCNGITITQFETPREDYFHKILSDRHVKYKRLGKVIKVKIQNENQEYFEFKTQKQEKALLYFLQNIFRKTKFRPGQEAIINRAILINDVIGLLPTGGGKSLTYQICALLQPGVTVVIDPINSLMKDQFDKLIQNGITKTAFINSYNTKEERQHHLAQLAEGKYQFLFISPERLQIQKFRDALSFCKGRRVYYSYAVIDEAHCVSEWGHDFRHSYLKLSQNLRRFCHSKESRLPLFGLTATASFDVLADVQRELEMSDDSIITLPPKAIDREELHFEIAPVSFDPAAETEWYDREKLLGKSKYPTIKDLLADMPQRIKRFEKEYEILAPTDDFYEQTNNEYKNAGVIFCPSKSDKLPFGVLHLKSGSKELFGLDQLPFLKIGTFFGTQDDNTVQDGFINEQARESEKNQEAFLNNETNLMIATKAFGMGIDKPNIRYTIHYAFPNSVESFYQEAGRAGRDGNPSLCSILFHPIDEKMNLDFYAASFRGITREKEIVDELLDEVRYEDNFFLNVFKNTIRDIAPEVHSISIGKDKDGNERYIYLNGDNKFHFDGIKWVLSNPDEAISIGVLDTFKKLCTYPDATRNFDTKRASEILTKARNFLTECCPEGNYFEWFRTKSEDGINALIEKDNKKEHFIRIGFSNDVISMMTDRIKLLGYPDFEEVIIKAAYKFSNDADEFVDNLTYNYKKFRKDFDIHFVLPDEMKIFLKESYYRIRNSSDTLRAIYRMSIVGIIDDYTIDYAGGYLEVRFKGKTDAEYKENFRHYLHRYLGVETTENWLAKIDENQEESILKRVLYTLIEYIDQEIAAKRKRSIEYMRNLCNDFIKEGEKEFRDRMVRYFTSKYARTDYLPKDTENGTLQNASIVKKYIEYIFKPPDGLGGQIDNAKHLRGACDNLRINMRENASIDLLTSFSFFALDAKPQEGQVEQQESPLFVQAKDLFRSGFKRLLKNEDWNTCKELLEFFNKNVIDINPEVKPLIEPFTNEILLNRTTYRLSQFLTNINDDEREY